MDRGTYKSKPDPDRLRVVVVLRFLTSRSILCVAYLTPSNIHSVLPSSVEIQRAAFISIKILSWGSSSTLNSLLGLVYPVCHYINISILKLYDSHE